MFRFSKTIRDAQDILLFNHRPEYHISSSSTYTNGYDTAFIYGKIGGIDWTTFGDDREFDPELARALVKGESLADFEEKYDGDLSALKVTFLKNDLSYEILENGEPHQCSCDTVYKHNSPSCKGRCKENDVLSAQDPYKWSCQPYRDIRPYYYEN